MTDATCPTCGGKRHKPDHKWVHSITGPAIPYPCDDPFHSEQPALEYEHPDDEIAEAIDAAPVGAYAKQPKPASKQPAPDALPENVGAFVDHAFNHSGQILLTNAQARQIAQWIQDNRDAQAEIAALNELAEQHAAQLAQNEAEIARLTAELDHSREAASIRIGQLDDELAEARERYENAERLLKKWDFTLDPEGCKEGELYR